MIVKQCNMCREFIAIPDITNDQYLRWVRKQGLIQDIMPNVPKEYRELLITGTCPKCWDDLFGKTPS